MTVAILLPLGNQGQVQNPSDTIMLFERPDDTDADQLIVTMADGASFMMPEKELAQTLQKQTGQTIEQLITQQENAGE